MIWRYLTLLGFFGSLFCTALRAQADDESVERVAATVVGATLLVRMCCQPDQAVDTQSKIAEPKSSTLSKKAQITTPKSSALPKKTQITTPHGKASSQRSLDIRVCSGVSLGRGLIVSSLRPGPSARFRLTLPGGEQIDAQLRVVDNFSSLVLLQVDNKNLPLLTLTDKPVNVGSRLLSAAAWGVESPVVSQGISSGIDRTLAGTTLPPLLQCDLRTTETSRGAGIVNSAGELSGIVVSATAQGGRSGWAYAVPVDHIRRLLAAHKPGELVVLKNRRPAVGLILMQGDRPDVVQVQRVVDGGPAHAAGIRTGDVILRAEGYKIRSAYEAIKLVMRRQAGDEMNFVVRRGDAEQTFKVKLGHAIVNDLPKRLPIDHSTAGDAQSKTIDPAVYVRRVGKEIEIKRGNHTRIINGKAELLEKASARYFMLIAQQMEMIERMRSDLQKRDDRIASLEQELRKLEARLPPADKASMP